MMVVIITVIEKRYVQGDLYQNFDKIRFAKM